MSPRRGIFLPSRVASMSVQDARKPAQDIQYKRFFTRILYGGIIGSMNSFRPFPCAIQPVRPFGRILTFQNQ